MLRDFSHGAFHMVQVYRMAPSDDMKLVSNALDQLVNVHPMLRSVHASPAFRYTHLCKYALDEVQLPFDDESLVQLLRDIRIDHAVAIFRARAYRVCGEGIRYLGLSIHHAVLDGPSQQIVYGHLLQMLRRERSAQPPVLVDSESQMSRDVVAHHASALDRGSDASPWLGDIRLPFERLVAGPVSVEVISQNIPEGTVATATRIATSRGLTLNALLLGTLAAATYKHSQQPDFTIGQTYLGRGLDQLQLVGSFSAARPMWFSFGAQWSLHRVCQHVLTETMRSMRLRGNVTCGMPRPSLAYELNDVRPIPRPAEIDAPIAAQVKLSDIFVTVNQYDDGYLVVAAYDKAKHDGLGVKAFLADWMDSWVHEL
uniref:Condensation domain-containing protein n=2 Tax=Prymnesium polylepis TaxID=72548 RepID=A0A7S4NGH8_9EUKA